MIMSNNPAKYEVLIEQYLRSILDIREKCHFFNTSIILIANWMFSLSLTVFVVVVVFCFFSIGQG